MGIGILAHSYAREGAQQSERASMEACATSTAAMAAADATGVPSEEEGKEGERVRFFVPSVEQIRFSPSVSL